MPTTNRSSLLIHPIPPFRLDFTVWALRRRKENLIDRWNGIAYRRVLIIEGTPVEIVVTQAGREETPRLRVVVNTEELSASAKLNIRRAVEGLFGTRVDLAGFYRLAARDGKLNELAQRFRGVKPPHFSTVFEGLVNAIACQQLSLSAGIQLLNRLAQNFSLSVGKAASRCYAFPRPEDLAQLNPNQIRKLGFNHHKARAMIELSRAIVERRLNLEVFSKLPDKEALNRLMELHGVGRWTAEYALLRGMGRWHVFPADDVGARNGLARWLRLRKPLDYERTHKLLERWKPYGGVVYFHMLMTGLGQAGVLS